MNEIYLDERCVWDVPVEVEKFPSTNAPSWRLWLLKFLRTAQQLKWIYKKCCQKISESLVGSVFDAFLEAKLSVEVELEEPSVSDVLSRLVEVVGVGQFETFEERFLFELRQGKQESLSDYARRVGAFKTFASKHFSIEHWASICVSGLTDECLRDIVKYPEKINMIMQELGHHEVLEHELNLLWSKMHRVRFCGARAADYDNEWLKASTDSGGIISDRIVEAVFKPTILRRRTVRSNDDVEDSSWVSNSGLFAAEKSTSVDHKRREIPEVIGSTDLDQPKKLWKSKPKLNPEMKELVVCYLRENGKVLMTDALTMKVPGMKMLVQAGAPRPSITQVARRGATAVTRSGQMMRLMSSGESQIVVTMTVIAHTNH